MDIGPSSLAPGLFKCHFDLDEYYGTMLISSDESELAVYQHWLEKDEDTDGSWAMDPPSPPRPAKFLGGKSLDALPRSLMPRKWFIRWRGRENGENVIDFCRRYEGSIVFTGPKFIKFEGRVDFGQNLGPQWVTGYKIAPWPNQYPKSWSSFSEERYEFERRDRWRHR